MEIKSETVCRLSNGLDVCSDIIYDKFKDIELIGEDKDTYYKITNELHETDSHKAKFLLLISAVTLVNVYLPKYEALIFEPSSGTIIHV